jgi:hypothetical protein
LPKSFRSGLQAELNLYELHCMYCTCY